MYAYKTAHTLTICIFFICTVFFVGRHGANGRVFTSGKTVHIIDSPEQAYVVWKERNVSGRTLILFDSYPHNMGLISYQGTPQLTKTNLIEFAIFQNIVRRIYFVVPEIEWNDFRRQKFIRPIREASDLAKGLYLYNQSGIPIIAVTPSSLPHIPEETLVYINNHLFKREEVLGLLAQNRISSDITVLYESAK
jgi:hypothetical protein